MPQQLAYTPSEVSITWNECNDIYGWYRTIQSMNSAGGRCHDNAHCEARITRVKKDLLYSRYDTKKDNHRETQDPHMEILHHFWNAKRTCSTNGGLFPMVKKLYYDSTEQAA